MSVCSNGYKPQPCQSIDIATNIGRFGRPDELAPGSLHHREPIMTLHITMTTHLWLGHLRAWTSLLTLWSYTFLECQLPDHLALMGTMVSGTPIGWPSVFQITFKGTVPTRNFEGSIDVDLPTPSQIYHLLCWGRWLACVSRRIYGCRFEIRLLTQASKWPTFSGFWTETPLLSGTLGHVVMLKRFCFGIFVTNPQILFQLIHNSWLSPPPPPPLANNKCAYKSPRNLLI